MTNDIEKNYETFLRAKRCLKASVLISKVESEARWSWFKLWGRILTPSQGRCRRSIAWPRSPWRKMIKIDISLRKVITEAFKVLNMVHNKHRSSSSGRRQPCVDAWEVCLCAANSKGDNTWVPSLILAIWLSRTHIC